MKTFTDFLFVFSNGFGVITGILLSLYFFRAKKVTDRILATIILVITLRVLKSLIYYFYPELSWSIINVTFALKLSLGPLLLFYTYFFLDKKNLFQSKDIIHFLPSIILFVGCLIITHDSLDPFGFLFIYFQLLTYIIFTYRFIKKQPVTEKSKWLKQLTIALLVIWCAYFFQLFFKQIYYLVGSFLYSVSLIYLTFKANVIGGFSKMTQHEVKYESSKLDSKTKSNLVSKIETFMNDKKAYLNPDITLTSLSNEVGATSHELSEIINSQFNSNFNQFINTYRINFAKELLKNTNNKVATIAYEAGFKSLSTFNTTFKKIEGYTPSEYRKKLSES